MNKNKNLFKIIIHFEEPVKHSPEIISENQTPITENANNLTLSDIKEDKIKKSDLSFSRLLTKSFLPFCALFYLNQEPRYGNELLNWLKQHSSLWSASPGTMYPLLKQMEKDNLIEGHWEPGVKRPRYIYSITEKGRDKFKKDSSLIIPQVELALRQLQLLILEINK
ncbi:MAG: helix-turn-helix transcriptional regulator [Actinobacteria bacterium]|nr:helix-turn-helix transcriptional regulator [Actinomycetota bacterium]